MLLFGSISKYSAYEEMFNILRRKGITTAQMHLLLILASNAGGEWSKMEDLRKYFQKKSRSNRPVAHSTVSRAIANISTGKNRYGKEAHGFVDKKDGEDEREQLYRINKRGLDFIERTFNH